MYKRQGTGVAFSRNPATGENVLYGEYLFNAQGEDVVAGIRTPSPIATLKTEMPEVYEEFASIAQELENHYKDMQDMEFTIENGKLFILQTRNGKRTASAAVKVAVDLVSEGMITKEDAILMVDPKQLDALLHPTFTGESLKSGKVVAEGLAASPGAGTGRIYFNAADVIENKKKGIDNGKYIVKIPLFVGNMAVSGSTRMQVTTVELLAAGAALEVAANRWLKENLTEQELSVIGGQMLSLDEYAEAFVSLNKQLSSGKALKGLAKAVDFEVNTYNQKGLVTYITHQYLLDIMTDTTERQPTFTLPPFRKFNDHTSEVSWAYIKDPLYPNEVAWQHVFRRPIKGLEWSKEDLSLIHI